MADREDFATAIGALIKDARWLRGHTTITDANTLTTEGVHAISSGDVLSITNRPDDTRAATTEIIVTPLMNGVVRQEWRQYEATVWRRWERSYAGGAWNAWGELPADISGLLPTSQGLLPDGTDWNTLSGPQHAGAYGLGGSYTYPNAPAPGIAGTLFNIFGRARFSITQLVMGGERAWFRDSADTATDTWNAWSELATTEGVGAQIADALNGIALPPARSSTTSITCAGDSLTDGYSNGAAWDEADSYPAQLGAWLGTGYTVTELGFSGATSDQINVRLGAQPLHMRIPGGQIPASGTVALTSDQVIGGWGGPTSFNAYGFLGGVYGLMQYTSAGGYAFTRSGSGDVVTTSSAQFEGEFRDHATDTIVYMAGRNDVTKGITGMESTVPQHVIRGNADLLAYATPSRAQVALCGTITRTDETPGSAGFEQVQRINTWTRDRWPERHIDVQGYLTGPDVWTDTGITPTQADLDAQAQGMTPPALFDDVTHYSRATAKAIAEHLIGPWLKERGWV